MRPITHAALVVASVLGAAAVIACSDSVAPAPSVKFTMDAPFCGGSFHVQYLLDGQSIGIDTLGVNAGTSYHVTSKPFATVAGAHTIGAKLDWGYVFPDRTVTLSAGQTYTDSLPFYCS